MNRNLSISSKPLYTRFIAIVLLTFYLFTSKSYALKGTDLREICQRSPAQCIEKVNVELANTEENSRKLKRLPGLTDFQGVAWPWQRREGGPGAPPPRRTSAA